MPLCALSATSRLPLLPAQVGRNWDAPAFAVVLTLGKKGKEKGVGVLTPVLRGAGGEELGLGAAEVGVLVEVGVLAEVGVPGGSPGRWGVPHPSRYQHLPPLFPNQRFSL